MSHFPLFFNIFFIFYYIFWDLRCSISDFTNALVIKINPCAFIVYFWWSSCCGIFLKAVQHNRSIMFNLSHLCSSWRLKCFSVLRRGAPGRPRAPHSLPGRRVSIRHHRHRLPDETHLDDHDGRLQVRQVPAAHHLAQPQLHGSAVRVRRRPEQRHHSSYTHAQTHRRRDCRIGADFHTEYALVALSDEDLETCMRKTNRFFAIPSCQCWAKHCAAVIRWLLAAGAG